MKVGGLTNYLAEKEVSADNLKEISEGNICNTYISDGRVYQTSEKYPEELRKGIAALNLVKNSEVSTPNIVYSDSEEPILITEAVKGKTLSNIDDDDVYRIAGRTLAQIHNYTFQSHGVFTTSDAGEAIIKDKFDWPKTFSALYHREMEGAKHLIPRRKQRDIDQFFYDNKESLPENPEASLLHFDYTPDNLIFTDGDVTVIDWDCIVSGDPNLEFIKALQEFKRANKPSMPFENGYKSLRPIDLGEDEKDLYKLFSEVEQLSIMNFLVHENRTNPKSRGLEKSINEIEKILEPN